MDVLLLTQEQCGFCTQAKELLDRLSVEYGFSLSTLDLASPEGEALAEGGLASVHSDMPDFGFTAEEVGEAIAYLNAIQQR